jgi:hypothetical protein
MKKRIKMKERRIKMTMMIKMKKRINNRIKMKERRINMTMRIKMTMMIKMIMDDDQG